jgi:Tol biopolymer transport system component
VALVACIAAAIAIGGFVGRSGGAVAPTTGTRPQVFVVGANGQHLRRVTFGRVFHTFSLWMPGSATVADIAYTGFSGKAWVESQRINSPGHQNLSASVSINGAPVMTFSAASRLTAVESCCHNRITLEVVGPPGSRPKVLDSWTDLYGEEGSMAWSPDGHLVAYTLVSGTQTQNGVTFPVWSIAVIEPDGQGRRILAQGTGAQPVFSPDGRSIAFCADTPRPGVYTVPTQGGPVRQIIGGPCVSNVLAWAPNGREVAYIRTSGSDHFHYHLFVKNLQSGRVRRLASVGVQAPIGPPAWSPASNKLAFVGPSAAVETINVNGTGLRRLVGTHDSATSDLAWSADGQQIASTLGPHRESY